jgi:hypothetical protein
MPFIPPPSKPPRHDGNGHARRTCESSTIERARAYLKAIEPAVTGQRGQDRTYRACCKLLHGFDLTTEEAWPLIQEWNLGCQPHWESKDLRRKLEEADREICERGYLLNDDRPLEIKGQGERKSGGKIIVTAASLAAIITRQGHFARDPGNLLYVYSGGVYVPRGERHIKAEIKKVLADAKQSDDWRKRLSEEVVEYIAVDAPELWE